MKRLVLSIPYGLAFRTIVACGILEECARRGAAMHVLLPRLVDRDVQQIVPELPSGATLERLHPVRHSLAFTSLKFFKQHFYLRRTALESFRLKRQKRQRERPGFHFVAAAAERAAENLLSERLVDKVIGASRQPFEDVYFDRLKDLRPDAVVLAKPGFVPEELPLIRAARRYGCPVICVDTTWDNMASKRPPYLMPDGITVWNNRMRKEAIEYYGFSQKHTFLCGGPQFDSFFQPSRKMARAEFLRSLSLDPARPLLVFTLNNPTVTPGNAEYVASFVDAGRRGMVADSPNIVVRLHPWDLSGDYATAARSYANLRIERPFTRSDPQSGLECLPTRRDVEHYAHLLAHADAVVNIASTTSLDAIASDAPVANIAFDAIPASYETSIARWYEFTHYRAVVDMGAVRIARSADELWSILRTYLADRTVDAEARARVREEFLTFQDGRNSIRVVDAIWEMT